MVTHIQRGSANRIYSATRFVKIVRTSGNNLQAVLMVVAPRRDSEACEVLKAVPDFSFSAASPGGQACSPRFATADMLDQVIRYVLVGQSNFTGR